MRKVYAIEIDTQDGEAMTDTLYDILRTVGIHSAVHTLITEHLRYKRLQFARIRTCFESTVHQRKLEIEEEKQQDTSGQKRHAPHNVLTEAAKCNIYEYHNDPCGEQAIHDTAKSYRQQ